MLLVKYYRSYIRGTGVVNNCYVKIIYLVIKLRLLPRHYLSVKTPGFAPQRLKWGIISLFIVLLLFPEISLKAIKKDSSSFNRKTISLFASPDTLIPQKTKDSLIVADTNLVKQPITDSLLKKNDTLASSDTLKKAKKPPLEAPVLFTAKDSIRFNIKNKQIYMFQDAKVKYQEITLDGNYIESDFSKKLVTSTGLPDSTGKLQGNPIFTEKQSKFKAKQITYNFDSKKGLIKNVITEQGEGFLHGEVVKKFEDNTVNILHGKYTTCNLDHPHFEFQFNRSKVIPDNKIVTGPAWLVIEDIPTPLFLPFGIFPNKRGQRSGIIIPTFGESTSRGFYLENGGYYWAINDYTDLTLIGDIYSRGSWALKPSFRYVNRYRYSGDLNLSFAKNIEGEKYATNYSDRKDFAIRWSHRQDPKANPYRTFTANVNIVSSKFNQYNPVSSNDYLSNTFSSSITYQARLGDNFNFSASASHSQNTLNKSIDITLPQMTLTANRFYPFRRAKQVGKLRWYENISVNYSANAENRYNTTDSTIFQGDWTKEMKYGMKHSIPISSSITLFKYLRFNNSISLTERWYGQSIRKQWIADSTEIDGETYYQENYNQKINEFNAAHEFRFTSSVSTTLYGMFAFKRGPIKKIRHTIQPSLSFSFNPDFSDPFWGYYKYYQKDRAGNLGKYSIFEGTIYGSPASSRSGAIGFSVTNNLEMKVKSSSDTITGTKNIKLIENFTISGSYDITRDSLNLSKITMSGRTTLIKDKLTLNFNSSWDPYAVDSLGRNYNRFEWDVNKRLLRLQSTSWNFSLNYNFSSSKGTDKKGDNKTLKDVPQPKPSFLPENPEQYDIYYNPDNYVDFTVPWNFNISYDFNYRTNEQFVSGVRSNKSTLIQTMRFSGDVSITPKWKFQFQTGYDFESKKITYSSMNLYRDLHCWEMRFNWIPFGSMKSWNFQINVKATMLQDLKLTKKKDFRDR